ncbi:MAG: response regulator transcription factor [Myxococcales bacterium]|nr:response regulator transcription factor [Myxococcales bacterium]
MLILLVDDEPAITESLAYALERGGLDSLIAPTLAEAERLVREHPVDLVILDLMLPDGNGLDWLRALRQRSRLPVIILSSHDDAVEHVVGLEVGGDDYVDKPFSPREMVARVRAVLRRVQPEPEARGDGAPIRLDADRREAWANGQRLTLSRQEFDLLAVFVAAPGRVFERDMLLDRAWGPEIAITERTVDVHVKALRKKLVAAGLSAETIETVRGVGYRLAEGSP